MGRFMNRRNTGKAAGMDDITTEMFMEEKL